MISLPRLPLAALALFLLTPPLSAQEPIRFARTPDISPDGKLIAFSYLGDIWTVEAIGGVARPVTMHEAHDINPVFSPDGKWIAFSSNRHGSYDVFVVSSVGGKPKRLTFDSGQDMVTGWSPDGKRVVFSSSRSTSFPGNMDCYTVSAEGGAVQRLPLFEGKEAYFSPDGAALAFVRGPGLWYRRGYRGSSNDDIWIANADGKNQHRLTNFDGQDSSPMWSPDGRKLYYVSELGSKTGCANIVCEELTTDLTPANPSAPPVRITKHDDDTVRKARISKNGEWIVYECGVDLWVIGTRSGAPPRKLAIEVNADDKSNTERTVTYTQNATEFALTKDEKHAVLSIHGELFLTKVPEGGKATRLTESAANNHGASFSPDGKSILFASDRSGVEDLYLLEADDAEHPELTAAHKFKIRQITHTSEAESSASYSPKGDRIAFLRAGKLWTMKADGTEQTVLVGEQQVFDYDWSPDGRYLAYARIDGSFASEIYIVPTDGSSPPRNVTRYATFNGDVSWSRSGNILGFISERRGSTSVCILSLQKPAAAGALVPSGIDWEDIHLCAVRVAGISAVSAAISPDGSQIAFRSGTGGDDLWVASSSGSLNRITNGNQSPRQMTWSRKSSGTIYYLNGNGELRSVRAGGSLPAGLGLPAGLSLPSSFSFGGGGDGSKVNFQAKMTIRRDEEYSEMFTQSWRALSDSFYDSSHHGANWAAVRAKYQPLVGQVAQREDLYALISLMLGELNASHLGISGRMPTADETTADLGLIFDETYTGPGLKVAEVLKRGPADKRGMGIKAGDYITAIDRTVLTDKVNLSRLLNNKAGEAVTLEVTAYPKDSKARGRKVEVIAIDRGRASHLMYERWVAKNAEEVAKQSGGKIGYIHIPSMNEEGMEVFVRALYSDNFDKEAIVIDVRYNGGGFTHDQVLNYLAGREHTLFRTRDGGEGLVMRNTDRKWAKPLVVLTNNRSYSDAEIFPHAFRALGLGKVVGQATGGHVIGTYSETLIDGSQFRIPKIGVFTVRGVNMEKEGVHPDVPVDITVEDWAKGIDTQLVKACEVVTVDVAAWKKVRLAAAASKGTEPTPGSDSNPAKTIPTSTSSGSLAPSPRSVRPAVTSPIPPAGLIPPAVE